MAILQKKVIYFFQEIGRHGEFASDANKEKLNANLEKQGGDGLNGLESFSKHGLETLEVPSGPSINTCPSPGANYQNTLKANGQKLPLEPSVHCLTPWQSKGEGRPNAVKSLNELGSKELSGWTNGGCDLNTMVLRGGCEPNTLEESRGHGLSIMEDRKHKSTGCLAVSNPGYQQLMIQQVNSFYLG
jgi:hypothetical protein